MAKKIKSDLNITQGLPMPLGVTVLKEGINFAVSIPESDACSLNLYEKHTGLLKFTIPLTLENRTGSVFSVMVKDLTLSELSYLYQVKGKEFIDPYARRLYERDTYGQSTLSEGKSSIKGGFLTCGFDWKDEKPLCIPYSNLIIYKLHVRGFTIHSSSGINAKGTILGITEKIPYLKELGINCVQLMPAYEYNEILTRNGPAGNRKLNYWGFGTDNYYFAPKASYCENKEYPDEEFKYMVAELHRHGIEVIMEMNFIKGTSQVLILDCLRYWVLEYHVDGFKISKDTVPGVFLAADPVLGRTKLMAEGWEAEQIYPRETIPLYKNLAEYNSVFTTSARRFLRGDEEQTGAIAFYIRRNPDKFGVINYITNHDGFTLMDLFSYDIKHNEKNGENNLDGAEYNYSWNCGFEGNTKNKKVIKLRRKQIRNAFLLLFLSQGTPLIMAGDEFGNSQEGNNNAYCQDNEIAWLNWELTDPNKDILDFVKQLIKLRKEHPILHMENELRGMDYISCGFPDISFHGVRAWYPDYGHYSRILGVMLAGNYVKLNRNENDRTFYFGFNMHWDKHGFDLPMLPLGRQWHLLYDTGIIGEELDPLPLTNQRCYETGARSIFVLISK